jgi:hypothetical protein
MDSSADASPCALPPFPPQVTFEPPPRVPRNGSSKVARSGILLNPSLDPSTAVPEGEASGRHGAALLYDWTEGRLDMVGPAVTLWDS